MRCRIEAKRPPDAAARSPDHLFIFERLLGSASCCRQATMRDDARRVHVEDLRATACSASATSSQQSLRHSASKGFQLCVDGFCKSVK